ncbi:MAG: ABC transporter ATP-binding protein [Verrucomicrobia bacterium]|jgi:branched-chain amino acid transport system ATP-binding protein|nr:ABC transporter ATP-binding protein [Verrucomicrobiota bacterium]MDA1203138.1 ABC transporter ATP-binding protein [Verrucomicrobiota bacterium]
MSETMLRVEDLVVRYGDIQAVKGISFQVERGEILALVGANGAGKTTTLRALSGMQPCEGSVMLEDRGLRGLSPDEILRLGLSHVPEGRGIFGGLTVMENLQLGAWIRRDKAARTRDLGMVMDIFPRLRERATQLAGTLSGGEQQMLAVGRALMSKAKILILDEPSMGLAPKLVQEIFSVIRQLNEKGTTILLVEQNANMALRLAHRACLLETGNLVLEGPASELLTNPRVREAYLGAG